MNKTKIYFTKNNIPQYVETDAVGLCYYYIDNSNLFSLINKTNSVYKLGRDDGPTIQYNNGDKIYRSAKSTLKSYDKWIHVSITHILIFANDTNHLICKFCKRFCKQNCF